MTLEDSLTDSTETALAQPLVEKTPTASQPTRKDVHLSCTAADLYQFAIRNSQFAIRNTRYRGKQATQLRNPDLTRVSGFGSVSEF